MKKFRIVTLGCRTNQYESQAFRDQLTALKYREATEGESADLCIVNTCTVTASADSSSRAQIRQLARHNPGSRLVITGCLAERKPELLSQIPGVTDVIANQEKERLIQLLFPEEEELPEFSIKSFEAHTRAFVKVQDGCNSYCTYCIIPYVRGRSRSRNVDSVLKEVNDLVANGYKEVVITGINVGDFDGGGESTLHELIRAVDQVPGLDRIRLSSIDPDEVNRDLEETILEGKKTCHSMHIVLQSGSNLILKRMNRKYTRQIFLETAERLKHLSPDFTFTTDVIVGFPGETESDFEETLDVLRQVKFAKVHMFPYSPREKTRAALYPNQVPPNIIQQRKQKLMHLSEQLAFTLREEYVGREMEVLVESKEGRIFGHTRNFLPVWIQSEKNYQTNDIVLVKCQANHPEGLLATPIYS